VDLDTYTQAAERAAQEAKDAAANAKKQREKEKKLLRKERSRLRATHGELDQSMDGWPDWDTVEALCSSMSTEELRYLCDQLDTVSDGVEKANIIHDSHKCVTDSNQRAREDRRQAAIAAADKKQKEEEAAAREAANKEALLWTDEEIRLLDKAVIKYPVGTRNRWEMVAKLVRTKTIEEVIRYTKHRQSCGDQGGHDKNSYAQFLQNRKNKDAAIDSPASMRDDESEAGSGSGGAESATSSATNGNHVDSTSSSAAESDGKAAAAGDGGAAADENVWSKTQELALVAAMKKLSKDAADRWGQISKLVPGKTKAECYTRFMDLKKTYKKNKGK